MRQRLLVTSLPPNGAIGGDGVTGVDIVVLCFAHLSSAEQDDAYDRIVAVRLTRLADAEGETGEYLRAMRRVAGDRPSELTREAYQQGRLELADAGEAIPEFSRVVRHFGNWAAAKEALGLGDVTTVQRIDARYRSRVHGRRPHFTDAELTETLGRCVSEWGRVPLLSEYEEWRLKELALMRARGELARLPSGSSFVVATSPGNGRCSRTVTQLSRSTFAWSRPPSGARGWPRSTATAKRRCVRRSTIASPNSATRQLLGSSRLGGGVG